MCDKSVEEEWKKEESYNMAILGSGVLYKAKDDPFSYALRLRTGETIYFDNLEIIDVNWVHLNDAYFGGKTPTLAIDREYETFPRGIDVRIRDIVWVMDAPQGS